MKKLTFILLFVFLGGYVSAQHYGGVYFAPNWVTSGDGTPFWQNPDKNLRNYDYTFGYTFGYQGLLMEKRRFSFSYGLQYSYQFTEYQFQKPIEEYSPIGQRIYYDVAGIKETIHALEIPATWRYNILKNKKLQPYVSVAATFLIPLKTNRELIMSDESLQSFSTENYMTPFSMWFDLGIGVNYKVKNYIFNVQPTIRPWNSWGKLGVGFSIMKKF